MIFIAVLVRAVFFSVDEVATASMKPTLEPGDYIISNQLAYGWSLPFSAKVIGSSLPKRGDIVLFRVPDRGNRRDIKRVIGLPGDRIQIRDKKLIINGDEGQYLPFEPSSVPGETIWLERLPQSTQPVIFSKDGQSEKYGPVIVPPGHLFLMGDHRDLSEDSRYYGFVPVTALKGRVMIVWLSLDWSQRIGHWPSFRWERIFLRPHQQSF